MLCQLKRSLPEHKLLNIHQGGKPGNRFWGLEEKKTYFWYKKVTKIATKMNKLRKLVAILIYRFIFGFFEEIVYNITMEVKFE